APLAAVAQAPVVVAVRILGTEADGFGQIGDGAVEIPLLEASEPATKKTSVSVRVVLNAGIEPRDRQIEVVFFQRLPPLLETGGGFPARTFKPIEQPGHGLSFKSSSIGLRGNASG